jgi:FHS family glucose/mannose:H+ symporter-like MFS transporter
LQQSPPAAAASLASNATALRALAPVFFYFAIAGVVTVMLGPLLPALTQRWQIEDAQAGALFTATFAGQFCGAWFAIHNLRASVISGALLTAGGCAALAFADFGPAHVAFFCVGLGLGAGLTAGNVIVGTAVPSSRARILALLNVAWSVGAIACPLLVRACAASGTRAFFVLVAAVLVLAALFAIAIPHQPHSISARFDATPLRSDTDRPSRMPLPPLPLLLFAIALLLYVGIENALGGWLPSYAIRVNPSAHAPAIALSFWAAELVGRLLMAAPHRLGETALYRLSLAALILTQALILAAGHLTPGAMMALTILSGLTIAPLYPLILAFLLARTGRHPRLGPLFASASLGGATLPWFTGIISNHFHALRVGLVVPAAGAILLLLLSVGITSKHAERIEA